MEIEHLAIWVDDIEVMRDFYMKYFNMMSNEKYINPTKNFTSYFLMTGQQKVRIELMYRPDITNNTEKRGYTKGLAHFSFSVGSKEAVNNLTERLRSDGYIIESEPRTSGDGYYESAILDPEGNYIEIIA